MSHVRKVFTQGNSLVITLPSAIVALAGIKPGDHVQVAISSRGDIILSPLERSLSVVTGITQLGPPVKVEQLVAGPLAPAPSVGVTPATRTPFEYALSATLPLDDPSSRATKKPQSKKRKR